MYLTINCHYTATLRDIDQLGDFERELVQGTHQIDENFGRIVYSKATIGREFSEELLTAIQNMVMRIVSLPVMKRSFKEQTEKQTNKWDADQVGWWFKDVWDAQAKAKATRQGFLFNTWAEALSALRQAKNDLLWDLSKEVGVYRFRNPQYGIVDKDGLVDGSREYDHMLKGDLDRLIKWADAEGLEDYEIFMEDATDWFETHQHVFNRDWEYTPQTDWVCVTVYRKGNIN